MWYYVHLMLPKGMSRQALGRGPCNLCRDASGQSGSQCHFLRRCDERLRKSSKMAGGRSSSELFGAVHVVSCYQIRSKITAKLQRLSKVPKSNVFQHFCKSYHQNQLLKSVRLCFCSPEWEVGSHGPILVGLVCCHSSLPTWTCHIHRTAMDHTQVLDLTDSGTVVPNKIRRSKVPRQVQQLPRTP